MLGRSSEKRATRGDTVTDPTPVEGNLVRVKTPKFISLVSKPANQVGIKVIRGDDTNECSNKGETMSQTVVVRRTRRSEAGSPVLRLTFPEGTDEAGVNEVLKEYGLSGYNIESKEGVYTATRSDLKSISNDKTLEIKLTSDGIVATVARQDSTLEAPAEKSQIALAAINFDAAKFTTEDVKRWIQEKCVDGTLQEPQNAGESYVVRRSDVMDGEETRLMTLEDGIQAVIVRADVLAVPDALVAVVSEAAYGNWGWGQLDFAASLADNAFSEAMRDSIRTLEDVLRNIVIYSALPIDVRKDLAVRALGQFGEYIGTVMDSLPRQLMVSVVRSANNQQEKPMTQAASGSAPETKPTEVKNPEAPLTRADIAAMIQEGIAAGFKAQAEAEIKRAEEVKVAEEAAKAAEASKPLTRADLDTVIQAVAKTFEDRVQAVEGKTVVRSEGEPVPTTPVANEVKDVFRGAIPGLRVSKK